MMRIEFRMNGGGLQEGDRAWIDWLIIIGNRIVTLINVDLIGECIILIP
jgi:hypothetical protein